MYSSPKSQYVCPSNQWSAAAFHKFLASAVIDSTRAAGESWLSGDDMAAVKAMVLEIWLDAAVPAGEG